jgi:hypothetical protein
MPIETGRYCTHCVDADGNLQSFDERFDRMVGWQARRHPEQTREQVERPPWSTWPRCPPGASTRG